MKAKSFIAALVFILSVLPVYAQENFDVVNFSSSIISRDDNAVVNASSPAISGNNVQENLDVVNSSLSTISGDNELKNYAVVTAPSAPLYAPNGTLDDEVIYGFTAKAIPSGDIVLLEMPYGHDPVDAKNVKLITSSEAKEWKHSANYNIIAPFADVQAEARTSSYPPLITLPRGAVLKIGEINSDDERYVQAELFGGIKGWIRLPLIRPVRKWNIEGEEVTRKNIVDDAKLYLGTSYRWGGRTPEGVDCSGFIHAVYNLNGLEIFRNSRPKHGFPMALKHVAGTSQDTHTLETLKALKPGDTIHWSGHVGLYLGEGKFIHANGKDFSTKIASLISGDEDYREDLASPSVINTFGTAFPDEPEKLSVKEFYARSFVSGDEIGYRFYVRAEGYAPSKAILYPEGISSDVKIIISDDVKLWRFVYSARDSEYAPEYFYSKPGKYKPAVELINEEGYRPSGKIISSGIYEMQRELDTQIKISRDLISDDTNDTKLTTKAKISPDIPEGFVLISEVIPEALQEIRYYSDYNFVGTRIDGYEAPEAILTKEAAQALKAVNDELLTKGYKIKIYDAYRPQRAVNHFVRWAKNLKDNKMKKYFYPELKKSVLFKQGYIARKSGHSRGSTVDLTLFDVKASKDVDMGGTFDYFGQRSHPGFKKITREQYANRMLLRETMIKHNFRPISTEWWHFTLNNEPYPSTYFDFPVKGIE